MSVKRAVASLVHTARVRHLTPEYIVTQHGNEAKARFDAERSRGSDSLPVVIPAHNEARGLSATLLTLARSGDAHPVVVTNN